MKDVHVIKGNHYRNTDYIIRILYRDHMGHLGRPKITSVRLIVRKANG